MSGPELRAAFRAHYGDERGRTADANRAFDEFAAGWEAAHSFHVACYAPGSTCVQDTICQGVCAATPETQHGEYCLCAQCLPLSIRRDERDRAAQQEPTDRRSKAIALARRCLNEHPVNYRNRPFPKEWEPPEWVIDAITETAAQPVELALQLLDEWLVLTPHGKAHARAELEVLYKEKT